MVNSVDFLKLKDKDTATFWSYDLESCKYVRFFNQISLIYFSYSTAKNHWFLSDTRLRENWISYRIKDPHQHTAARSLRRLFLGTWNSAYNCFHYIILCSISTLGLPYFLLSNLISPINWFRVPIPDFTSTKTKWCRRNTKTNSVTTLLRHIESSSLNTIVECSEEARRSFYVFIYRLRAYNGIFRHLNGCISHSIKYFCVPAKLLEHIRIVYCRCDLMRKSHKKNKITSIISVISNCECFNKTTLIMVAVPTWGCDLSGETNTEGEPSSISIFCTGFFQCKSGT